MSIQSIKKTNEQHAIPQNFMDVEFKLIGSLTMRQFTYLLVFFGSAYGVYALGRPPFKIPLALFLVLLGLGLAFVPLEERGLDEWITNFFKAIYTPTQRIWRKSPELPSVFIGQNMEVVNQELITLAPTSSRRKLEEYLQTRDSQETKVDTLDIPEAYYTEKARSAFAADIADRKNVSASPPSPPVSPPPPPKDVAPSQIPILPESKSPSLPEEKKEKEEIAPVEKVPASVEEPSHIRKPFKRILHAKKPSEIALTPLTPDRHSGRRFVDLTPGRGYIVLPIRGEKRISTSDEIPLEENIQEKTTQLQQLLSQLRGSTSTSFQQKPAEVAPVESVKKKEKLFNEVAQLQGELTKAKPFLKDEPRASNKTRPSVAKVEPDWVVDKSAFNFKEKAPIAALEVPVSARPNIVSGVVQNTAGESLSGVVLIIKDEMGSPVRALKTNSLGRFSISTPLSNGNYTVEIDSIKKTKLSFDIISLPLVGKILPPLEIIGK